MIWAIRIQDSWISIWVFLPVALSALGVMLAKTVYIAPDAAVDEGDFSGVDADDRTVPFMQLLEMSVSQSFEASNIVGEVRNGME
jgi:hypothetical protein